MHKRIRTVRKTDTHATRTEYEQHESMLKEGSKRIREQTPPEETETAMSRKTQETPTSKNYTQRSTTAEEDMTQTEKRSTPIKNSENSSLIDLQHKPPPHQNKQSTSHSSEEHTGKNTPTRDLEHRSKNRRDEENKNDHAIERKREKPEAAPHEEKQQQQTSEAPSSKNVEKRQTEADISPLVHTGDEDQRLKSKKRNPDGVDEKRWSEISANQQRNWRKYKRKKEATKGSEDS